YYDENRRWLSPSEVRTETDGTKRRAFHIETGKEVNIGPVEKMSKSKKNTVDPDIFTAHYGADTARWFMLSDSPPERDVQWSDEGVQGAWRFIQRVWRLVNEAAEVISGAGNDGDAKPGEAAEALRRAAHRSLHAVAEEIDGLRFNRAVATIYEFANTISATLQNKKAMGEPGIRPALREALHFLIHAINPMMPHLAEECWAR